MVYTDIDYSITVWVLHRGKIKYCVGVTNILSFLVLFSFVLQVNEHFIMTS